MDKKCSKCEKIKALEDFPKNKKCADGRRGTCKECTYSQDRISSRKYYQNNKEKIAKKNQAYRENNKEKMADLFKKWATKNKAHIARKRRERISSDPLFKAVATLRRRLNKAIKSNQWSHSGSFQSYIGCSQEQFFAHIQSKFKPGMTWENHGINGWHLDHIIPLSSAKSLDELYALSHFSNIQPLWAIDNIKKSDNM